ncbi:MAG: Fur family transcriptional regulator [Spirochaetota bacterium]
MPGPGRGRGFGHGGGRCGGRGRGDGPFRRGGYRLTAPRQAVLGVMREANGLLSADEVYLRVVERMPGIGIATVYRTLQLLHELGVLTRITQEDGKARYRFADEEPAAHRVVLTCNQCGRSEALETQTGAIGQGLSALADAVAETGFTPAQSVHHYFGVCASCSAQKHRDG